MANGFKIASCEIGSSLVALRKVEQEQDGTEWWTFLHSRLKMEQKHNSNFNLIHIMKNSVIRAIVGMVTIISIFLACAEANSAANQLLWSGSWLLVCGISGKVFEKYCMTKEEKEEQV